MTVITRKEEMEAAAITEKWKNSYYPGKAEVERATSDISGMNLNDADLSGVPAASLARLLSLCTDWLWLPRLSSEQWTEVERLSQNWRVKRLVIERTTLDKHCSEMLAVTVARTEEVWLLRGVNIDFPAFQTAFTARAGRGNCRQIGIYYRTEERYREQIGQLQRQLGWRRTEDQSNYIRLIKK